MFHCYETLADLFHCEFEGSPFPVVEMNVTVVRVVIKSGTFIANGCLSWTLGTNSHCKRHVVMRTRRPNENLPIKCICSDKCTYTELTKVEEDMLERMIERDEERKKTDKRHEKELQEF